MINNLIKLANYLDSMGLYKEAHRVDQLIEDTASESADILEPIHEGSFSLDVSMVGGEFVYLGKMSNIDDILNAYRTSNPPAVERLLGKFSEDLKQCIKELAPYVDPKYPKATGCYDAGMDQSKFFVPIGNSARLLLGADVDSVPIIIYDDVGIADKRRADISIWSLPEISTAGIEMYTYGKVTDEESQLGVMRYFSGNNESYGRDPFRHFFDLKPDSVSIPPYLAGGDAGKEATDNYLKRPWEERESVEVTEEAVALPEEVDILDDWDSIPDSVRPYRSEFGDPDDYCLEHPDSQLCKEIN